MHLVRSAVLYAALALTANAALADTAALEALREGDMKKLTFHAEPQPVPDIAFVDADGAEHRLADYKGQYVLLNFWATWCAPCRKEMPSLDRLQGAMGGEKFQVLPIATLRNSVVGVQKFFEEAGVQNLPVRLDPKAALAHEMGVMGLPITVILNPEGQEIARLMGDAEWDSESARAIFTTLTAN